MSEANKQVVLKFIEAMGDGDPEAAGPCVTDDAYTLAKGFGSFAGVRERDTILATIGAFHQLMPAGMKPEIVSVIAEGDRVVVEFEGNGVLSNGESYDNQYCMVFKLREGKICQVNEYFCTLLAEQKLWPLIEKMAL